jgi:hypothetical protein
MELQRIFTPEYVNQLTNDIHVEHYLGDHVVYDESEVRRLKGIEKPEGLEDKMLKATSDFDAAVILYENYQSLTPGFAASPVLWVYLTHVDLFNYVKKVWPNLERYDADNKKRGKKKGEKRSEEDMKKYIRDHWLISPNGLMRTSLMNLWWSVYMTVDESFTDDHKYDLTKVFFSNDGLRTRRLGTGHLGRNRNALKGILSFMKDNPEIFNDGIENRMIWITRHFNLIGGTKPLSNMPSDYFYKELEKFKTHLQGIKNRDDVSGPTAFV